MKVSKAQQDINAQVSIELIGIIGHDIYMDCKLIQYYVDNNLHTQGSGRILINRRENFPYIQIMEPDTGEYTEKFQENSSVFNHSLGERTLTIETNYTPYFTGKNTDIKVVIVY